MSTLRNSRPVRTVAAWLCTTFSVSCTAAQIRPLPADCPPEAVRAMEEVNLLTDRNSDWRVLYVDSFDQAGGKMVSRVGSRQLLPEGTLLFGQLWTEGISKEGKPAAYGRYTEALLPDGRRIPVCVNFLSSDGGAILQMESLTPPEIPLVSVRYWR